MSKEVIICLEIGGDQNSGIGKDLEAAFLDLKK